MGCVGTIDDTKLNQIANTNLISQSQEQPPLEKSKTPVQSKSQTIKTCTVNLQRFSPFQYFLRDISKQNQSNTLPFESQHRLNMFFLQTIQLYKVREGTQKKYKQLLGQLHKQTLNRYTPISNQMVGLKTKPQSEEYGNRKQEQAKKYGQSVINKKMGLMNSVQFCDHWDLEFLKVKRQSGFLSIKKRILDYSGSERLHGQKIVQEMIKDLKQFDLICYHSLLACSQSLIQQRLGTEISSIMESNIQNNLFDEEITNKNASDDILAIIRAGQSKKYIWMMRQLFAKPVLNATKRIQKLVKYIQKAQIDVVFLQDANPQDIQLFKAQLKCHRIVYSKENYSGILIKQTLIEALQFENPKLTLVGHNSRYLKTQREFQQKSILKSRVSAISKFKKNQSSLRHIDTIGQDVKFMLAIDNKIDSEIENEKENINVILTPSNNNLQNQEIKNKDNKNQLGIFGLWSNKKKQKEEIENEVKENEQGTNNKKEEKKEKENNQGILRLQSSKKEQTEDLQINGQQAQARQTKLRHQKMLSQLTLKIVQKVQEMLNQNEKKAKERRRQKNGSGVGEKKKIEKIQGSNIWLGKQKLSELKNILQEDIFKNNVIQFIGCLILISVQIKADENSTIIWMRKKLIQLKTILPNHTIIVGANIFPRVVKNRIKDNMKKFRKEQHKDIEESDEEMSKFNFAPNIYDAVPGMFFQDKWAIDKKRLKSLVSKYGYFTTSKKKTQFHILKQDRDSSYLGADSFIITNEQIQIYDIQTCEHQIRNNKDYCKEEHTIPNECHPFASYFVVAGIKMEIKKVQQAEAVAVEEQQPEV